MVSCCGLVEPETLVSQLNKVFEASESSAFALPAHLKCKFDLVEKLILELAEMEASYIS